MYSNSYCSYKFAPKQEKFGQSSHKEYSNNILKYLEFTAIVNACTKKVWKLIECPSYAVKNAKIAECTVQHIRHHQSSIVFRKLCSRKQFPDRMIIAYQ